jgi:hypothetical protein
VSSSVDRPSRDADLDAPVAARRQRFLALPTGVVLALCVFLPAVRVCGTPTYPISMPPFWSPYLLGVAVAVLGGARTMRGLRGGLATADVVMALTAIGWGVAACFGGAQGVGVALVIAAVAAAYFKLARWGGREQRAAHVTIAIGALCTPWFALLAFDPEAMFGSWISLGAALAAIIAGLEWRRELRRVRVDPIPRAVTRGS